jgi:hypothetical protein
MAGTGSAALLSTGKGGQWSGAQERAQQEHAVAGCLSGPTRSLRSAVAGVESSFPAPHKQSGGHAQAQGDSGTRRQQGMTVGRPEGGGRVKGLQPRRRQPRQVSSADFVSPGPEISPANPETADKFGFSPQITEFQFIAVAARNYAISGCVSGASGER